LLNILVGSNDTGGDLELSSSVDGVVYRDVRPALILPVEADYEDGDDFDVNALMDLSVVRRGDDILEAMRVEMSALRNDIATQPRDPTEWKCPLCPFRILRDGRRRNVFSHLDNQHAMGEAVLRVGYQTIETYHEHIRD